MNPKVIAGLINRIYSDFNVYSFENRLKLQKFTYLLQHMFNLNVGYSFEWYIYGPYSIDLARDSFNVDFSQVPQLKFTELESEEKFKEFIDFIDIHKEESEWLEIAASIHFLKKLRNTKESTIKMIINKRDSLQTKENEIRVIYDFLEERGLL
jgi:uncharacterized protein YwgA